MTRPAEEGPGYFVEQRDDGPTLVVTGWWTPEAERVVTTGRVEGLDLNYAKGFKNTDLLFLQDWPLRSISILARTIDDLTPVYRLAPTLRGLTIEVATSARVDLAKFPLLEVLSARWPQVRSTIADPPILKDLYLGSYSESDLTALHGQAQLTRLSLKDRPRIRSLRGLATLGSIEQLGVFGAPLQDITELTEVPAHLNELHLESCSTLGDLGPVGSLANLKFFNLSECGEIDSARPLAALAELEVLWLFGTTRVLDNDLSAIASLPRLRELRIRSRRSYSPPVEDIAAAIQRRTGT